MKKVLVAILLFFYFFSATGFVVNLHYCMGHLASVYVSFSIEEDESCSRCGMHHNKKVCCYTKSTSLKVQDVYIGTFNEISLEQPIILLPELLCSSSIFLLHSSEKREIDSYFVPPDNKHPVYLQNRVLRI